MQKRPLKEQGKMHIPGVRGFSDLRIKHYPERANGKTTVNARYKIKCGCCELWLEIFYDDESLEINGVDGSIENWREILLPLLGINPKTMLTKEQEKAKRALKRLRKKYK